MGGKPLPKRRTALVQRSLSVSNATLYTQTRLYADEKRILNVFYCRLEFNLGQGEADRITVIQYKQQMERLKVLIGESVTSICTD